MAPQTLSRQIKRQVGRMAEALYRRWGIDAGGSGRRWPHAGLRAPAREMLATRQLAAARARWFAINTPEGAAMANAFTSNLVADGPSIQPLVADKSLRALLVAGFNEFWDRADIEGLSDLGGILQRLAWLLFVDGEFFVHLAADSETGELRLRILSPEQVGGVPDQMLDSGGRIIAGVEFDATGRRVAYHIRENVDVPLMTALTTRRIPAEDICHVFEPKFAGQVRGLSGIAAAATTLSEVASLRDALLAKAKTAALFGGVIYNPNATDAGPRSSLDDELAMEPGGMIKAPPGWSVEFSDPPSMEGAVEFLRSQIRALSSAAGIPYELVSGDLSQVNYSSARLGLLEFRRRMTALQRTLIVARFLQPVWRRYLLLEGLAGRVPFAAALSSKADFVFPGWAQIDPLKETNADIRAIDARIKSRVEVISARGRDPETVDAEIAQDPAPAIERVAA
jgi:lambda family phage portal protein